MVITRNEHNTYVTASEGCMLYFADDNQKLLFSECAIPGDYVEGGIVEVKIEEIE